MKTVEKIMLVLIGFLLGLTVATGILTPSLPSFLTQTFELVGAAPGNPPVTLPHWRLETGIVWQIGLLAVSVAVLVTLAIHFLSGKRHDSHFKKQWHESHLRSQLRKVA